MESKASTRSHLWDSVLKCEASGAGMGLSWDLRGGKERGNQSSTQR